MFPVRALCGRNYYTAAAVCATACQLMLCESTEARGLALGPGMEKGIATSYDRIAEGVAGIGLGSASDSYALGSPALG
jgi:hypothetical protein